MYIGYTWIASMFPLLCQRYNVVSILVNKIAPQYMVKWQTAADSEEKKCILIEKPQSYLTRKEVVSACRNIEQVRYLMKLRSQKWNLKKKSLPWKTYGFLRLNISCVVLDHQCVLKRVLQYIIMVLFQSIIIDVN